MKSSAKWVCAVTLGAGLTLCGCESNSMQPDNGSQQGAMNNGDANGNATSAHHATADQSQGAAAGNGEFLEPMP
jgi:hypothetical protein